MTDEETQEKASSERPNGVGKGNADPPRQETVSTEEKTTKRGGRTMSSPRAGERTLTTKDIQGLDEILERIERLVWQVDSPVINENRLARAAIYEVIDEARKLIRPDIPIRKQEALTVLTSMSENNSWTPRNREIMKWALKKINKALRRDERWQALRKKIDDELNLEQIKWEWPSVTLRRVDNYMTELERRESSTGYTTADYESLGGAIDLSKPPWQE